MPKREYQRSRYDFILSDKEVRIITQMGGSRTDGLQEGKRDTVEKDC